MTNQDWLTAREIGEIFAEEIDAVGGKVTETIEATPLLFARSVLPGVREVARGDRVQAGVALRATDREIAVHPYVFRQVCTNGAIRAHAIETRRLDREEYSPIAGPEVAQAIREAVRASASSSAFLDGVREMQSARETEADAVLSLLPLLSRLPSKAGAQLLASIMQRHDKGRDRSRFGLMNAVTSVARDTRDPDLRWRLEEFGGGVPVATPAGKPRPVAVEPHAFASR